MHTFEIVVLLIVLVSLVFSGIAVRLSQKRFTAHKINRDLVSISSELSDLRDLYEALIASHKKLRSRIGMRRLREKNSDEMPDPAVDPAAWKREMRKKLHIQGAK